jgi:hypothetical protein
MIKYLLITGLFAGIGYGLGSCAGRAEANEPEVPASSRTIACDPDVYDLIYRRIVKQALDSPLTPKDVNARNDAIETLRALCRGQNTRY